MINLDNAYNLAISKIERTMAVIGATFPHVAILDNNTKYNNEKPSFWTGGFWAGLLWLAYQETKNYKALELAIEIEEKQDAILDEFIHLHHDVGFMWIPTAVTHYKNTCCQKSFVRAYKAASILASRFNIQCNFIRAWNNEVRDNSEGWAIIDCMMNLPLLYWASKEIGDPRFSFVAKAHANCVLKNFCRADGTVPHIVEFNPLTGEKIRNNGGQGKDGDSAWSRGQAWAIYGFAISYRETGDENYFNAAIKIARKFYLDLPEDKIPLWDFKSDEKDKFVKDTSSAAIASSGMLELSRLAPTIELKNELKKMATELLTVLTEKCAIFDDSSQSIIQFGTVSYANKKHVNVPIIYGDFYYVEALAKLKGHNGLF